MWLNIIIGAATIISSAATGAAGIKGGADMIKWGIKSRRKK